MQAYHYLLASFPSLSLDAPSPYEPEAFLDALDGKISKRDLDYLRTCTIIPRETNSNDWDIYKRWASWAISLGNALIKARANVLSVSADPYLKTETESFASVATIAHDALACDSPLEAEWVLVKGRWNYLDEISLGQAFNKSAMLIYFLRLQLVYRVHRWDPEKGKSLYQTLYGTILTSLKAVDQGKAE